MAIEFPANPTTNVTFTVGSITYKWDGAKWIGLGVTPTDRLIEGSNKLEINASNNLIWTGNNVGIGTDSPAVSLDLSDNTDAVALPTGTTAQRPSGTDAYIRKNSTNNALEFYTGTEWVEIITDYFPTGSTTLG